MRLGELYVHSSEAGKGSLNLAISDGADRPIGRNGYFGAERYARNNVNLKRLAATLAPFHPRLRGAPEDVPFLWDAETLRRDLNFTLKTDLGDIDLMGEVKGLGLFEQVKASAMAVHLFGVECKILSLEGLIVSKRAAGRLKDQLILPELEALREATEESGLD